MDQVSEEYSKKWLYKSRWCFREAAKNENPALWFHGILPFGMLYKDPFQVSHSLESEFQAIKFGDLSGRLVMSCDGGSTPGIRSPPPS